MPILHLLRPDLTTCAGEHAVWDAVRWGNWHGETMFHAAARALRITIRVHYPEFDNGKHNNRVGLREWYNRLPSKNLRTVEVFYTHTNGKSLPTEGMGVQWRGNHFVPVLPVNDDVSEHSVSELTNN
jgi:hypothetical protein